MRIDRIVAISGLAFLVTGCATVAGVGKDVSAVGRGITHVADEVRDEVFLHNRSHYNQTRYRVSGQPVVTVNEPCDPHPELAGGTGLQPCASAVTYR